LSIGDTGDLPGPGDGRFAGTAAAATIPPPMDPLVTLPLRSSLSSSMSPCFCGTGCSSTWTCTSRPSFHVGIAGRASSLTTARVESNVANWGLSGWAAACGVNVGMALERYCWLIGRVSMGGAGGAAACAWAYGFWA
jgi:hypothetical protein